MTVLRSNFDQYRDEPNTEREKGNYFEELTVSYLRHEATYADLYSQVWLYSDWTKAHPEFNISQRASALIW